MRFLKSNTATRVTVGPFFDKTDGVTPETALTVTSCKLTLMVDDAGVPTIVLDVAPTASGGSNDMVHVTGDDAGFYDLELAAANVNYVGRAMLAITDAATHCPVFHEFTILPARVYDSLFAITGQAPTFGIVDQGTAQSATASTLVLRSAAAFADDELNGAVAIITSGTGVGQARVITDYVSSTDTATVSPDWTTTPSSVDYIIVGSPPAPTAVAALAPVNLTHVVGAAVSTTTAQLGVNVVSHTGHAGVKKNTALSAFMFQMFDSTLHAPATGKTVTVTRSLDGGAFGAGTLGSVTEVSGGWYKVDFGAGDLNGTVVAFRATAALCDDTNVSIITGP